jgi:hypothetical protein
LGHFLAVTYWKYCKYCLHLEGRTVIHAVISTKNSELKVGFEVLTKVI